jgi:HEPN domain-containing protein
VRTSGLLLFCMIITPLCLVSLFSTSAQALSQNEITLSFQWLASKYYQGDWQTTSVVISLQSTCGDELKFTSITLYFPWNGYGLNLVSLLGSPISIPSGGSCTFPAIYFEIPSNAPIGWVDGYVSIEYQEHHWYGWTYGTWKSRTMHLIYVHDAYEKIYNNLKPTVESKITQAENANFQGADSKSLLQQAVSEHGLAEQLANQGKWSDAATHLQTASNLIDQALAAESTYLTAQARDKASIAISVAQSKISGIVTPESSEAVYLVSEANSDLVDAQNAYNSGDYDSAYQLANAAASLADQAIAAEKSYQAQKTAATNMIIEGGALVAIVVSSIAILLLRRRRKKPEPTTAPKMGPRSMP